MSHDTTSRQDFLKKAAVASGAVAAADFLPTSLASAETRSSAPYELTYWDWWSPVGSPHYTHWFDWVKKTFEAQNPGITVKYQFLPWGDPYLQKIQAAVAAGNPPDVMHISVAWARDLWERKVLYDMTELVRTTPEVQPSQFFPAALAASSLNGHIFGVPMEGPVSYGVVMNVDLIAKKLHWPASTPQDIMAWPDKVKTWNDLTQLAVALTERRGGKLTVAGFNYAGMDVTWLASLLRSNGSHFYKPGYSGVNIDTPQALECVQWMLDLYYKYKVSAPINAQRDDLMELVSNHAAMIMGYTFQPLNVHDTNPGFRLGMMPWPRGPHGTGKGTISIYNMVSMPRSAKNAAASWKFIKFFSSTSTQLKRLEIAELAAPLKKFFHTPQWNAAALKVPALAAVPLAADVSDPYPFYHSAEVLDKVNPSLTDIDLRRVSPQSGLRKAQHVTDQILSGI